MARLIFLIIVLFAQWHAATGQVPGTMQGKSAGSSARKRIVDSTRYIPKPIGWTNDYKNLFSPDQVLILDSLISAYERRTTVEISVATIDSMMMGPIDFEPYTLLMLRTWGVGKKETNNGILIVIAPDLRRVRIQNGYGIEKKLSNEDSQEIIDSVMMPRFRTNDFFNGTKDGIQALIGKLQQKDS